MREDFLRGSIERPSLQVLREKLFLLECVKNCILPLPGPQLALKPLHAIRRGARGMISLEAIDEFAGDGLVVPDFLFQTSLQRFDLLDRARGS